jgi:hypothetical protein
MYQKRSSVLKNTFMPLSISRLASEKTGFAVYLGVYGCILKPRLTQHRLFQQAGSFVGHFKRLGQKAPPVEFAPEQPSPSTHL